MNRSQIYTLPQRIVHFDLKGAPLKLDYLGKVLHCIKSWGATGILLEWEDTFPYSSGLEDIGSLSLASGDGLYSMQDISMILTLAEVLGLEVIQLVQTIGHMEYVLKHPKFQHLRELSKSPAVLCPSKYESQQIVRQMLTQALAVQPNAKYLHIGADEAWYVCICEDCKKRIEDGHPHGPAALYLDHIRNLAIYLHEIRPHLNILIWDDMMRMIQPEILREYNLGELVQPVVWNYNDERNFQLPNGLWSRYSEVFPKSWAGSAFKGAASSRQMLVPKEHYLSNHKAWLRELSSIGPRPTLAGIILTGWSRFDHFATLCELMPLALPTLRVCLKTVSYNTAYQEDQVDSITPDEWPGYELSLDIEKFSELSRKCWAFLHGDAVGTWLNQWQIKNNYTNPMQIEGIVITLNAFLKELQPVKDIISERLLNITGQRTTNEWISTNVMPVWTQLLETYEQGVKQME